MSYIRLVFRDLPALCLQLSRSPVHFVLLYFQISLYLFSARLTDKHKERRFTFSFLNVDFQYTLYAGSADVMSLVETFVYKEYDLHFPLSDSEGCIVDLGAHTGNTSIYFAIKYPQCKILSVEPSPRNYSFLKKNTEQFNNIRTIKCAVSETEGEVSFFDSESTIGSSLRKRFSTDIETKVSSMKLETLIERYSEGKEILLVKADIEGAEESLFESGHALAVSKHYVIEVHYDLITRQKSEFLSLFSNFSLYESVLSDKRSIIEAYKK